jgi:hypothetical protein
VIFYINFFMVKYNDLQKIVAWCGTF